MLPLNFEWEMASEFGTSAFLSCLHMTGENLMPIDPSDDQRQVSNQNEYAVKTGSGSKPGFVLSAWALALGAVALVIIISGLLVL